MTPTLAQLQQAAREYHETVLDRAMRIAAVPSPSYAEQQRAEFVAGLLRELGYEPEIDEVSNVYARRGTRGGKAVMIDAHIDTVFPAGTEINISRDAEFLRGPGIGDNASNVAGMLTAIEILDTLGVETESDIIMAAVVCEEGLGNLRGAREAVRRFRDELGAVIVLDGRIGRITNVAVGSERWRVTVRGPGGHSFGAFGIPSAIHGLGRVIAAIADLQVPSDPKTTFNVGVIEGGTSVNTIAPSASAIVDMRSTDPAALARLVAQVRQIVETRPGEGLESEIEVLGERPAGVSPEDSPIVQFTAEGLRWLGYNPEFHAASTDMNIAVSQNIPTVCTGLSEGERAHTIHEHIRIEPFINGLAALTRLCLDATAWVATGKGAQFADG